MICEVIVLLHTVSRKKDKANGLTNHGSSYRVIVGDKNISDQ